MKKLRRKSFEFITPQATSISINCCGPVSNMKWKKVINSSSQKKKTKQYIKLSHSISNSGSFSQQKATKQTSQLCLSREQSTESFQKVKNDFISRLTLWNSLPNPSQNIQSGPKKIQESRKIQNLGYKIVFPPTIQKNLQKEKNENIRYSTRHKWFLASNLKIIEQAQNACEMSEHILSKQPTLNNFVFQES